MTTARYNRTIDMLSPHTLGLLLFLAVGIHCSPGATILPGCPYLDTQMLGSGSSVVTQYSSSVFRWNYASLSSFPMPPSIPFASINFSAPADLSGLGPITFSVRGNNSIFGGGGIFRIRFRDAFFYEAEAGPYFVGDSFEEISITRASLSGVNWTGIWQIVFVVDPQDYPAVAHNGFFEIESGGLDFNNAAPTDLLLTSSTILENSVIGSTVGSFAAEDPDVDDTFTYSLATGLGDADNSSFTISSSNLLAAAVFDFELTNTYSIRVQANDRCGLSIQKVFTITILDVVENPPSSNTFYVSMGGDHTTFDSWATAATNIQSAVDAASDGNIVWVSNGVYSGIGPVLDGGNVVVIDKDIAVRSVNGPSVSIIDGQTERRCVYLNHPNASLEGFSLNNGEARGMAATETSVGGEGRGGGVYIAGGSVRNCVITNCHAFGGRGYGLVTCDAFGENCVVTIAQDGGDAFGGGVYLNSGEITDSRIAYCSAFGAYGLASIGDVGIQFLAATRGRHAYGGGMYIVNGLADAITLYRTHADGGIGAGGGARGTDGGDALGGAVYLVAGKIRNSIIRQPYVHAGDGGGNKFNLPTDVGGDAGDSYGAGVYVAGSGEIESCSIWGGILFPGFGGQGSSHNGQDGDYGGAGSFGGSARNCIYYANWIVFDSTPSILNPVEGTTVMFSRLRPDPGGSGNITNEPQFAAADLQLAADSPCRDIGQNDPWMTNQTDRAGVPRILNATVDMGANEYWGQLTSITVSNGQPVVQCDALTGETYRIERTTDPTNTWQTVWGEDPALSSPVTIVDTNGLPASFFRAVFIQ